MKMDKDVAEQLMSQFMAMSGPLNEATRLTEAIPERSDRESIRKGLGTIMGLLYTDLMLPIIAKYPDLDPDKRN